VSSSDADPPPVERPHSGLPPAARLELAVERILERARREGQRAARAEARVHDLEEILARFARGDEDPVTLLRRIEELEAENEELRERMREGVAGVDRLLTRVRFLQGYGG
jgi:predicted RNase H-like nuclease (RuvC/YqgF family)